MESREQNGLDRIIALDGKPFVIYAKILRNNVLVVDWSVLL